MGHMGHIYLRDIGTYIFKGYGTYMSHRDFCYLRDMGHICPIVTFVIYGIWDIYGTYIFKGYGTYMSHRDFCYL